MSGPFFTHDPVKTWQANVRAFMEAAAKEGEADVRQQMEAGASRRQPISLGLGRVSEHVVGRVTSLSGKQWAHTAVVSVNNSGLSRAEGIALMAAAARVEGSVHAFRRTAGGMRKAKAVNRAELLKGLA